MIQDIAFSVQHPITGKELEWRELVSDSLTSPIGFFPQAMNWVNGSRSW